MDKRNYKQLLLPLLLTVLVLVGGGGCGDDEDYEGEYLKLIGSWKAIESTSNMPISDMLIFQKNGWIDAYEPIVGWSYHLVSDSEIKFQDPTGEKKIICKFVFDNDSTLTIYNFVNGYLTADLKDVTFLKIK